MTSFIPLTSGNRHCQQMRRAVDQITEGAALLKRLRAIIETQKTGDDYAVAAAQWQMPPENVQAMYELLVASEPLSSSPSFASLVTRLG